MLYSTAWVVKLGPQDDEEDQLYSYFINTGASGLKPYVVVAKDLKKFKTKYDHGVKKWLATEGFSDPVSPQQGMCV